MGKIKKIIFAKKGATKPNFNKMRKKKKGKKCADKPDLKKYYTNCRLKDFLLLIIVISHSHTLATAETLKWGSGNLGSHTSLQLS